MTGLILIAFAALTMGIEPLTGTATATTVRVDGPGDGDGQNGDEFDTIQLAATALLASSEDGVADRIEVVVDTLEGSSFYIFISALAGSSFDDLVLEGDGDGNGVPCLHVTSSQNAIWLTAGQAVTIEDFLMIPDNATGDQSGSLDIYTTTDALGASATLRDITITASAPGNVPVDPTTSLPASAARFTGGWAVVGEGLSEVDLRVERVTSAHTRFGQVATLYGHGITAQVVSCEFLNSLNGLSLTPCSGEAVFFEDCLFEGQQSSLMTLVGVQEGTSLDVTFGPGCVFRDLMGNGIEEFDPPPGEVGGGDIAVRFAGTAENPIIADNVLNLYTNLRAVNTLESVEHLHSRNSRTPLITVFSDSIGDAAPRFSDCLIVADSDLSIGTGALVIDVTQDPASAEPVIIERCTFHDDTVGPAGGYTALTLNATGPSTADVLITDCIFSGREDGTAIGAQTPIGGTLRLERCALAQQLTV
ncbi:hypothetical protein JXA47_10885, partial [Candidatus Sumerlaeota bacterium]|nr:hypothetical protein [Candidatus Sumerlaeota bacterium]